MCPCLENSTTGNAILSNSLKHELYWGYQGCGVQILMQWLQYTIYCGFSNLVFFSSLEILYIVRAQCVCKDESSHVNAHHCAVYVCGGACVPIPHYYVARSVVVVH